MPAAIRITHIIVRLSTGGAEKSLFRLLRATHSEFDHRVICIGRPTNIGRDIEALGVPVLWLDERKAGPAVLWKLRQAIRSNPPHILQGWMYYGNVLASLMRGAAGAGARVVWNIRQSPADFRREKWRTRLAIAWARRLSPDLVIYNSCAGQQAHEPLGYNRHPHRVIPNGIDLEEYSPAGELREQIRSAYKIGRVPWVAVVCRLHPLKGIGFYLQAVRQLLDEGTPARFALAGSGMSASEPSLQALMQESGVTCEDIDLLGEVAAPHEFLPALDVLVLPSLREGTPNILLEAMACGVYTVATRVGDAAQIVRDDERLAEPGVAGSLTEVMRKAVRVVANETDRADRVAAERAFLSQHYETARCMNAYRDSYVSLAGHGA